MLLSQVLANLARLAMLAKGQTPKLILSASITKKGGEELPIRGGSYKRSFVYAELHIQYTNSYTDVVYCRRIDIEENRIQ